MSINRNNTIQYKPADIVKLIGNSVRPKVVRNDSSVVIIQVAEPAWAEVTFDKHTYGGWEYLSVNHVSTAPDSAVELLPSILSAACRWLEVSGIASNSGLIMVGNLIYTSSDHFDENDMAEIILKNVR